MYAVMVCGWSPPSIQHHGAVLLLHYDMASHCMYMYTYMYQQCSHLYSNLSIMDVSCWRGGVLISGMAFLGSVAGITQIVYGIIGVVFSVYPHFRDSFDSLSR